MVIQQGWALLGRGTLSMQSQRYSSPYRDTVGRQPSEDWKRRLGRNQPCWFLCFRFFQMRGNMSKLWCSATVTSPDGWCSSSPVDGGWADLRTSTQTWCLLESLSVQAELWVVITLPEAWDTLSGFSSVVSSSVSYLCLSNDLYRKTHGRVWGKI